MTASDSSSGPFAIRGVMHPYDWGMIDGLSQWTGVRDGRPQAELWFGAHPNGDSPLAGDPERVLTDVVAEADVPLLVKFLAAATPLSLQIHPDRITAAAMWSEPRARALLADRNEKTEMLVALEPFTVLAGWREVAAAGRLLRAAGVDGAVLAALERGDRRAAVSLLFGRARLTRSPDEWLAAVSRCGLGEAAETAMAAVARKFGDDPGVAVAALLEPGLLEPGDAAFLPAGVPHAYVHGRGVEVMTSSDNVLRLGLTRKAVSVPDALAALRDDRVPTVVPAPADGLYSVPGAPFRVRSLVDDSAAVPAGEFRLVLPVTHAVVVGSGDHTCAADPGEAVVVPADTPEVRVASAGLAFVVSAGGSVATA